MSYRYFDHPSPETLRLLAEMAREAEEIRLRHEAAKAKEGEWLPIARPRWWQDGETLGAVVVTAWFLAWAALMLILWLTA